MNSVSSCILWFGIDFVSENVGHVAVFSISLFPSFCSTDEIMQQEIRPLLAVDIIEQLHRQFAMLSGKIRCAFTLGRTTLLSVLKKSSNMQI